MQFLEFLAHHGMGQNPFAEEDAQTDAVFKEHCIASTFHPAWDKIFGTPADPATSIVFGEKGSGKTALRLQIQNHIAKHNAQYPKQRCFVIPYDDFNPFLDAFQSRVGRKGGRPERVLREFQLWDHMDAILSVGVTSLMDLLFKARGGAQQTPSEQPFAIDRDYRRRLRAHQGRDLLLLAACYDNSTAAPLRTRWKQLRFRLLEWAPITWTTFGVGVLGTAALAAGMWWLGTPPVTEEQPSSLRSVLHHLGTHWKIYAALLLAVWAPWGCRIAWRGWTAWRITRGLRVLKRRVGHTARILTRFSSGQLADQPLPIKPRTDDRYALLAKLQSILESLGFTGIIVIVDRIDEPHLVNGSADLMRAFLWPLLDNKFLRQPGLGIKFLLPAELTSFIDRESSDFYQRARLDKQNLIPSLRWTGESLLDMTNARLQACRYDTSMSSPDGHPRLADLFDPQIGERRLVETLESLRVPRHVFKFLYRVIAAHCNAQSGSTPSYQVSPITFEAELAVYRRELQAADRGLGTG